MKKTTDGNILVFFGIIHSLLGLSPYDFGKQFAGFGDKFFFKVSEGIFEFPLLNGIPVGILVNHVERTNGFVPMNFKWTHLIVVLVGAYMIPFSGMTFLYMLKSGIAAKAQDLK